MPRFLLVALLLVSSAVHAQLLVKDDTGRSLVVRQHFKRIVTLAPFLTEAAFAAGAGDLVVAVDGLSDYPREAAQRPRIATGAAFSIEAIAGFKPDLVLAWKDGIRTADVEALTGFGATVYLAQPRSLEDVPQLLTNIGALTGRNAQDAVTGFESRLQGLKRANANKPRLTVFIEIWSRPLTTVGGSSLLSEAVQVCRGENVFGMLPGSLPRVEFDEVAQANPYVILGVNSANNADEFQANWMSHYNITSVNSSRLM
jgi:iron complex transport system substrate-binding protein